MNAPLHFSRSLDVPAEYVTGTGALLAVRGAGKTNAGRVMAEEMYKARYPFVAIDPVGSWWGLRAGRDGSAKGGLPIFIFGGKHGDAPLTRSAGELVADVITKERLTCIVDMSEFDNEAEKKAFLLPFAKRLFKKNQDPLHLFLEEADDYIPQKPMGDELHLKRAWENIVRRGRGRGLGMTILTQRSAVVNKDVLTQVENLFVLRTTGPQDIAAVEAWVKYHKVNNEMLASLAGLEDGESWIWSPHLMKDFKRFRFRLSNTFDSGATPKNLKGTSKRPVAYLHDVSAPWLKDKIAETLETAKDENPAVLRSRIAKLKAELHSREVEITKLQQAKQAKPAKALPAPNTGKLQALAQRFEAMLAKTDVIARNATEAGTSAKETALALLQASSPAGLPAPRGGGVSTLIPKGKPVERLSARQREPVLATSKAVVHLTDGSRLAPCPRALLEVLVAVYPKEVSKTFLSIRSKYSMRSSGFANGLSLLRTSGLLQGTGTTIVATEAGVKLLPHVPALPEGKELQDFWASQLAPTPRALLQVLCDAYPDSLTKEEISARSAKYNPSGVVYSLASSGFANGLSMLRGLKLIDGKPDMKASSELFDG